MKKAIYFLGALVFLASCGGEDTPAADTPTADTTATATDTPDEPTADAPEETPAAAPTGTWSAWVDNYNAGYDMIDGNKEFDGTEVTLEGVIEKLTNYQDQDGNESIMVCFGETEGTFSKCAIQAIFPTDMSDVLNEAEEAAITIKFTGTVSKKKFDEIQITDCKLSE